jgi:hypothetical protein
MQLLDGRRGAGLGPSFQQLAQAHQGDHGGAGLEIDMTANRDQDDTATLKK